MLLHPTPLKATFTTSATVTQMDNAALASSIIKATVLRLMLPLQPTLLQPAPMLRPTPTRPSPVHPTSTCIRCDQYHTSHCSLSCVCLHMCDWILFVLAFDYPDLRVNLYPGIDLHVGLVFKTWVLETFVDISLCYWCT